MPLPIERIVSGGQTGADRAALDVAIALGIPHGGWCPKGRRAEDGPIPDRYNLTETPSTDYLQRTERNVRDSDATVVFSIDPVLTRGSRRTAEFAVQLGNPWLHLHGGMTMEEASRRLRDFIQANSVRVLNCAGPRASNEPTVGDFVTAVLSGALRQ